MASGINCLIFIGCLTVWFGLSEYKCLSNPTVWPSNSQLSHTYGMLTTNHIHTFCYWQLSISFQSNALFKAMLFSQSYSRLFLINFKSTSWGKCYNLCYLTIFSTFFYSPVTCCLRKCLALMQNCKTRLPQSEKL